MIEITKEELLAASPLQAAIICRRRKPLVAMERRFLAACGSKVVFKLDRSGAIISATSNEIHCTIGCTHCQAKMKEAAKIILKSA